MDDVLCDKWIDPSDYVTQTSDATTGVHVMFHTMPMVNVMFSQSLICCFGNHRTRNITALSILCGCFPSACQAPDTGGPCDDGEVLCMVMFGVKLSGDYALWWISPLIVQWSLRGHGALFTLTPVIMRLKCDRRSSSGDVTAVVTKFVWSRTSKTILCVYLEIDLAHETRLNHQAFTERILTTFI